ncbi:MAG TPA: LON peptidase substrate-binding domain-containing protein [Chloroflexota bacterium]|nr:LON peptidase substrate-binding domain-containing protein [Chloroflexota bacterium]
MGPDEQELALFPLQVVLFPGMALPLHIFEERYKLLMARCLERGEQFGVVLIREGFEVGEPAEPYAVGTEALLHRVERLPEGRFNLVVVGGRRFRCVEHLQERPYRVARVAWLPEDEAADAALAAEVRAAAHEYIDAAYALAQQPRRAIHLADDPRVMSYQVGALLQIAAQERQALLEESRLAARLRHELLLLRRETRMLQLSLVRRDLHYTSRFSRN